MWRHAPWLLKAAPRLFQLRPSSVQLRQSHVNLGPPSPVGKTDGASVSLLLRCLQGRGRKISRVCQRESMSDITDQLIVSRDNGIGFIQLDNQAKRNAMTFDMWQVIPKVLDDLK